MITNGRVQLWPFLRVALFLVVGVLIGDALDCRVPSCVWMWTYVVLLSAFVASYFFLRKHPIFQTVVLFIMVVAGGLWRTTCFLEDYNVSFSDAPESYEAVVETQPVEKERSVKCQLAVTKGRLAGHSIIAFFPKKDYQYEDDGTGVDARQLVIGDGLVVCSRLEKAEWERGTADKGRDSHFDYGRWLKVHDVIARTYVPYGSCARKVLSLKSLSMPKRLSIVLDRVRRKAMTNLAAYGVSDDAYAIVGAMTLGDKTALSDAARETYSVVGVSHVLALSGLHLGIIFMLLAAILIPFGSSMGRLIIGNLVLILSIWAYALMVGMSSSIVRSAVMYTCFAFFGLMSAKPQSLNSLGIAVVVLVLGNPMSLWDVGFQMSFLAVFGILAFNALSSESSHGGLDMDDVQGVDGCSGDGSPHHHLLFRALLLLFPFCQLHSHPCRHAHSLSVARFLHYGVRQPAVLSASDSLLARPYCRCSQCFARLDSYDAGRQHRQHQLQRHATRPCLRGDNPLLLPLLLSGGHVSLGLWL